MKRIKLILVLLLIINGFSTAQDKRTLTNLIKKQTIKKIAQLLKEVYLFPEKSKIMGADLKKRLKKGQYKSIIDMKTFAEILTRNLRSICNDGHLVVVYNPERVARMRVIKKKSSEEEIKRIKMKVIESQSKNNFGFKKVEILDGNIGYLDFRYFRNTDYAGKTAEAAMAFISNTDAQIIDLRNNYGGGASMYLFLISYFFDSDPVLLSTSYNKIDDERNQSWSLPYVPGKRMIETDIYILMGKRTYSAAEQFAYSLKHLRNAKIIGKHSGGGAHMATKRIVNDDFYIYVPFLGSINPVTKTNWEGVGVKPDIEVDEDKALNVAYSIALKVLKKRRIK